jgi:hypothetical protein
MFLPVCCPPGTLRCCDPSLALRRPRASAQTSVHSASPVVARWGLTWAALTGLGPATCPLPFRRTVRGFLRQMLPKLLAESRAEPPSMLPRSAALLHDRLNQVACSVRHWSVPCLSPCRPCAGEHARAEGVSQLLDDEKLKPMMRRRAHARCWCRESRRWSFDPVAGYSPSRARVRVCVLRTKHVSRALATAAI